MLRRVGGVALVSWMVVEVTWSATLGYTTIIIYEDGEFIGPQWMAIYTALFATGALTGVVAAILTFIGSRVAPPIFLMAGTLSLLSIIPGYTFSWTGFSGFGTAFFVGFVLTPSIIATTILSTTAVVLLRSSRR